MIVSIKSFFVFRQQNSEHLWLSLYKLQEKILKREGQHSRNKKSSRFFELIDELVKVIPIYIVMTFPNPSVTGTKFYVEIIPIDIGMTLPNAFRDAQPKRLISSLIYFLLFCFLISSSLTTAVDLLSYVSE